jgi:hypothetical protein
MWNGIRPAILSVAFLCGISLATEAQPSVDHRSGAGKAPAETGSASGRGASTTVFHGAPGIGAELPGYGNSSGGPAPGYATSSGGTTVFHGTPGGTANRVPILPALPWPPPFPPSAAGG